MSNRTSTKRNTKPIVLLSFAMMAAYGLPALAQQPSQSNDRVVDQPSASATPSQCSAGESWDPGMGMCMPDGKKPKKVEIDRNAPPHPEPTSPAPMPDMPSSVAADNPSEPTMKMPMSGDIKSNNGVMFQLNQFMLYSDTSGPRGHSRLTGPGTWMLMYDKDLSAENHLRVNVMGTPEQWTVGDKGTPQLFQTDHVDAMHAHDEIMALEFRDIVTLDANDKEQLTFLFAPRGEAAIGPAPFMHRESAEGNPDAPLGHGLQDGFHDASTVMGVEYQFAGTSIEATAFSGQNITWPFPVHSPDSYSLRVIQSIDDHFIVGASYANALLPDDTGGTEHNQFMSAWLTTSYLIEGNTLKSSLIWGQGRTAHGAPLNSFLEEAVFQQGQNKFYGRAETLQITPDQLQLAVASGAADPNWAKALTAGYERTVFEKTGVSLFLGGSYTQDFTPSTFQSAYGSGPGGVKVYLRIAFDSSAR